LDFSQISFTLNNNELKFKLLQKQKFCQLLVIILCTLCKIFYQQANMNYEQISVNLCHIKSNAQQEAKLSLG